MKLTEKQAVYLAQSRKKFTSECDKIAQTTKANRHDQNVNAGRIRVAMHSANATLDGDKASIAEYLRRCPLKKY